MPVTIDAAAVKAEQRANWDALSTGWESALAVFERGAAPLTGRLLELAGVAPGHSIVDIATGLGEPALSAAAVVGPTGRVVGVDISPAMLAVARRRAIGLPQVEFVPADLESIDLPAHTFDAALSRFGLMFAVDRVAALRAAARLLVPGGVLAAAVWGPPAAVPMMALGYAVLSERLALPPPPPGLPGPFSLADPATVVEECTAAGFVDVAVTEFVVPFRLGTTAEFAAFHRAVTPPRLLALVRERFGTADDPATWQAVADAAEQYRTADGDLLLPSTALVIRAVTG